MHLKVIRLFVESVLRYGLPANYIGITVLVRLLFFSLFPFLFTLNVRGMGFLFENSGFSFVRISLIKRLFVLCFQPEPKTQNKILSTLNSHFSYLAPRSNSKRVKNKAGSGGEDFLGEYQTIMEQEFLDFVVFDVPWIVN